MRYRFTLLISLFCYCINAQETSINFKKLNEKVAEQINKHRKTLKLNEISPDSHLKMAAEDHSTYLLGHKKLTHEQNESDKKTPFDRVKFYGNKTFESVGENVLYLSLENKYYDDKAIADLAQKIFIQWKNSPPHYKNIINKDFDFADLGFSIDQKLKRIYATQVFGTKGISIPNQLSTNAFGIIEKKSDCKDLNLGIQLSFGNGIKINDDEVILYYHDLEKFKSIFNNTNDGIAVDYVEKNQMECGKKNKFDISSIYDGVLGKPVYRDELLQNNKAENNYKIITTVGKIPTHLIGKEFVANLILLFDNCACNYVTPLEIDSKSIDLFALEPIFKKTTNQTLSNQGILYTDEILFEFDRNTIKPKNNWYTNNLYTIHSYEIYSFSSVEGNEIINKKLYQERAIALEKFAKDSLGIKKNPNLVESDENWEKCLIQLEMENLEDLSKKSKSEIRKYINAHKNEWQNYLDEQRTSSLVVNYYGELKKDNLEESDYTTQLINLNLRTAIFEKDYDKVNLTLEAIYKQDYGGVLFENLVFNQLKSNDKLVQNASAALLKHHRNNYFKTVLFLKNWLGKFDQLNKEAQFNLLALYCAINDELLQNWDVNTTKLSNVNKPIKLQNQFSSFESNSKLQANYNYISLYYSSHINDYENVNLYFSKVYLSFLENIKTSQDRLNLALFLNHWSSYQYAFGLLKSSLNDASFSKGEALLLAQSAIILIDEIPENNLKTIVTKAYQMNSKEWCNWQKNNLNLMRNEMIKSEFCKKCK